MKNTIFTKKLKLQALMIANQIRTNHPENENVYKSAYARVKTISEIQCPYCWVKNEKHSELEVEAYAMKENLYACKCCGFNALFPKAEQ